MAQHRRAATSTPDDRQPLGRLPEPEAARSDGARGDVTVFDRHVLLEPAENELVDAGDVVEDRT